MSAKRRYGFPRNSSKMIGRARAVGLRTQQGDKPRKHPQRVGDRSK